MKTEKRRQTVAVYYEIAMAYKELALGIEKKTGKRTSLESLINSVLKSALETLKEKMVK